VATSAQLKEAGFAPGVIEYALNSGKIDRLTRGVYCSLDVLDDEFAAVTMRWPKCILSHGTALYLLGLSDRVPGNLSVSVPRGYNPQELRRIHPDMRIHREGEGHGQPAAREERHGRLFQEGRPRLAQAREDVRGGWGSR